MWRALPCVIAMHQVEMPCLVPVCVCSLSNPQLGLHTAPPCFCKPSAATLLASSTWVLSLDLNMPLACLDRQLGPGSGVGTVPGGAGVHAGPGWPQQHEEQRLCQRGSANTGSSGAHSELLSGCLQLFLLQVHSGEAVWRATEEDLEPTQLQGAGIAQLSSVSLTMRGHDVINFLAHSSIQPHYITRDGGYCCKDVAVFVCYLHGHMQRPITSCAVAGRNRSCA